MKTSYVETVKLLLDIIPVVFKNNDFALKGGTAINLFCRDMPRLSVDLDLVYTKYSTNRNFDLSEISKALLEIKLQLKKLGYIVDDKKSNEENVAKLLVKRGKFQVKIEVNYVIRGTLLPTSERTICDEAIDVFKMECSAPLLDETEIYAGKLVAALDRQHPRDLYDIYNFYKTKGLSEQLIENFVCYLCCHDRPFKEVLAGNDKNISKEFADQFMGMTREEISIEKLLDVRTKLRRDIIELSSKNQKDFLLSFAKAQPSWDLIKYPHLKELPAIRWKLLNLEKLKNNNPEKFEKQFKELETLFVK